MREAFRQWPLLIVGGALIVGGLKLIDPNDPSDARALLLGVGCVVIGAALTLIIQASTKVIHDRKTEEADGGDA